MKLKMRFVMQPPPIVTRKFFLIQSKAQPLLQKRMRRCMQTQTVQQENPYCKTVTAWCCWQTNRHGIRLPLFNLRSVWALIWVNPSICIPAEWCMKPLLVDIPGANGLDLQYGWLADFVHLEEKQRRRTCPWLYLRCLRTFKCGHRGWNARCFVCLWHLRQAHKRNQSKRRSGHVCL